MQERIVARNVSKWYGEVRGVSGVNANISQGIIGLIGPNGAGKSTLLRLFSGLLFPSQGEVEILGEPAFQGRIYRRQIGVAPQKESVYPFLTCMEFVTQLTQMHGFSKKESRERAMHALEQVKLVDKANRTADTLSKGMKQCLKMAQAIAHDPTILFLDEVLEGCDPLVKYELKNLIRNFGRQGKTVLLSSHYLQEIESITDEVLVIDRGQVMAYGKIKDLHSLLGERVRSVLIEGQDVRAIARKLLNLDFIVGLKIQAEKSSLTVETKNLDGFCEAFGHMVCEESFSISRIEPKEEDLASLFRYLTRN